MIDHEVTSLTPNFQAKVKAFFAEARSLGLWCYIFESKRTIERQYELFGKGRTVAECLKNGVPAKYANPKAGKPVTWTLKSNHLTGNAIDVVFDISKDPQNFTKPWKEKIPSWSGDYKKLIVIAKKHGIRNLTPIETCHFENNI